MVLEILLLDGTSTGTLSDESAWASGPGQAGLQGAAGSANSGDAKGCATVGLTVAMLKVGIFICH